MAARSEQDYVPSSSSNKVFIFSFQSHEQTETKKRKGNKAGGKKVKRQRGEETVEDSLTLNTAARSVEILHLRVNK